MKKLLLPVLILFILFTLWPLAEVVKLSLYKTNFIKTTFVGLDNYLNALNDPDFIQSVLNSIFYACILVPGQLFVSLFLALELYTMNKKWQDSARILFYIPILSSGIIIAGTWKWLFHIDGPINWLLSLFNIEAISWFSQGITAIPIISIIVIFSSFGGNLIILLSAILSIDKGILEAAKIDGASDRQIKYKIIIPIITPTIILIGLLSAISAFQIFENIFALAPQVFSATMTFYIYQQGFLYSKYGMAAAEAVLLLLLILTLSFIKSKVIKEN